MYINNLRNYLLGRITNPHARSGWITNPAELEEEF